MEVLIIFNGQQHKWWQRFLKNSFAHCFILVKTGGQFILIDPISPEFKIINFKQFNALRIINHYQKQGCIILHCDSWQYPQNPSKFGLEFFSCVITLKRILGITNWGIFTPYQLFKYCIKWRKFDIYYP